MVYGIGINDMPKGWTSADSLNQRVYQLWKSMIRRCYDEKHRDKYKTYKDCYVCERWLKLSNFVEDIVKIENYEYWRDNPNQRISLDKDIKSNNKNKCYCLEECMFVSHADNTRQAVSTRDNTYLQGKKNYMYGKHRADETRKKMSEAKKGKNNPMYGRTGESHPNRKKIVLVDPLTKQPVFTWQYKQQATKFYNIKHTTLDAYLKGKRKKGHLYNGFEWYYLSDWQQLTK